MASPAPSNPKKSPAPADAKAAPEKNGDAKKRTPLELFGIIGSAVILIGFVVFLSRMLSTDLVDASANDPIELEDVKIPAAGEFITLKSVESIWRPLREDDRTDKKNKVLPEVTIVTDSGGRKTGVP